MQVFRPGDILVFDYENYKGITSTRLVRFEALDYGDNDWYPERQWFMRCYDMDKKAARSFALAKINGDAISCAPLER
jgi:predicted DNA-binding transcriptional regulator YafY